MLNAKTAMNYVERIEAIRAAAAEGEAAILDELRAQPDYESNQDRDLLEVVSLRAEAAESMNDAEAIIGAFDWVYDETSGENVKKLPA